VSKVQNWPFSLGYAPTDYCCFGNYNQNRTVETRFGFKTELVNLIIKAYTDNIQVYVGIVLNRNSGMQLESNPFTRTLTDTSFISAASRKFTRTSANAYKNANANNDRGVLGDFLT
jgi:alpha-amylase